MPFIRHAPDRIPGVRRNTVIEALMRSDAEWAAEAKRVLRAEMVRSGIRYDELSKKLAEIGVEQLPPSIRMTINRGRFRAMLLLQCLIVFSSRRRHTIFDCDWSSDVCSSD